MNWRQKQLNELIQKEVSKILAKDFDFGKTFVTVTSAIVSPGHQHVKILLSIFPENRSNNILEQLQKAIYKIQKSLNKKLFMRPVPKISFELDRGGEQFSKISKLLNQN